MLKRPGSKAILTVGRTTPSYSCAVLHEDNRFYLFDPHSRIDAWMFTPDDYATVTMHSNISALILFVRHLSATLSDVRDLPFEIAQLDALADSSKEMNAFDGF